MSDYIPVRDNPELRAWILAYLAALPTYGATVGVTVVEQGTLTSLGNAAIGCIDNTVTRKNSYDSSLADRDLAVRNFTVVLRPIVRRIKANANYNEMIGENLGIVADNPPIDPNQIKPTLTLTVNMGFVRVRILRNGAESVNLFSRRSGQAEWTFLARVTRATYLDETPLANAGVPEIREYMAQGFLGDSQVGSRVIPRWWCSPGTWRRRFEFIPASPGRRGCGVLFSCTDGGGAGERGRSGS